MTTATVNLGEIAEFWRVARRLYIIYAELDRTFEIGVPACRDLEYPVDRSEAEVLTRVRSWFDQMDSRLQVWQLRQLLQSTNLQTEENLRYLINRHLDKPAKAEIDRDKIDFLLVQYYAHCAPQGLYEQQITLEEVGRVLQPALRVLPASFPSWTADLNQKLQKLNESSSLEELQDSGALVEVRELKLKTGEHYFDPACLVAFTRFNFLTRRAFFRAMHLDLHAIRSAINDLELQGCAFLDCTAAGLSDHESLEHLRHLVHQWKTPFRAPYSGGSSFTQLIQLRHVLDRMVSGGSDAPPAKPAKPGQSRGSVDDFFVGVVPPRASRASDAKAQAAASAAASSPASAPAASAAKPEAQESKPASAHELTQQYASESKLQEGDFLEQCVADITEQLATAPPKKGPSVSPIVLAGCKLLIATWEAQAFIPDPDELGLVLQRAVASRTILHVAIERTRKNEPTDLGAALEIARSQVDAMKAQIEQAKKAANIDAAVNLAATNKRLLALIEEGEKLQR